MPTWGALSISSCASSSGHICGLLTRKTSVSDFHQTNWALLTRLHRREPSVLSPSLSGLSLRSLGSPPNLSSRFFDQFRTRPPSAFTDNDSGASDADIGEPNAEQPVKRRWKFVNLVAVGLGLVILASALVVVRSKSSLKSGTVTMQRLISSNSSVECAQESTEGSSNNLSTSGLREGEKETQLPSHIIQDHFTSKEKPYDNFLIIDQVRGEQPSSPSSLFVRGNRDLQSSSLIQWTTEGGQSEEETRLQNGREEFDRKSLGRSAIVRPTYVSLVNQEVPKIDEEAFQRWLEEVKDAAIKKGVKESIVVTALEGVRPSKRIMELDSTQPEVKLTLEAYLRNMINAYRVTKGVAAFQENEMLLTEISSKYGVPSPILVAIWGIESSYGGFTGTWDVLQALVTLGYASEEPRRALYFKGQLLEVLNIIQDGHGPHGGERLLGSWAGAMGQCQFMPSSFQVYAVDYDGDGRKDIWESRADIFASMANYLKENGWQEGGPIAHKVDISGSSIDKSLIGVQVQKSMEEWIGKFKVQVEKGQPEVPPHEMASLVAPDGLAGPAYLVFNNFKTILRYNASSLYSIAVWHLALQVMEGLGSTSTAFPELGSTLHC